VECRRPAGKKLSFPACSGKADGSVTVTKAWTAITASKVTLMVNGDTDLSPTEVRLTLPGACAP